ncbi:solute carrier family 35 domain-containing protein [Ditylenchus destructor]|uniref:Solute carrier family 35 domain-containing protein n=1 Tax=Ditylenchus destructor TaxID=166010 RepID=A0AAD4NIF4_9BILA|nr:solute carrier family 35 domain-containing protein [Ditylenchus destructor]
MSAHSSNANNSENLTTFEILNDETQPTTSSPLPPDNHKLSPAYDKELNGNHNSLTENVEKQPKSMESNGLVEHAASRSTSAVASPSISIPSPPPPLLADHIVQHQPPRISSPVFRRNDSPSSSSSSSYPFYCPSECCENQNCTRTMESLLLGQLMSLCLCGTAIGSQMLANHKFNAPAAQNFLNYFFLAFVYGTIVFFRPGEERSFATVIRRRGWKYFLLALIDVEANFLIVYAYQFTNITSIQLLDCFTIPVVMVLSWLFLNVRYMMSHITGVALCLIGIALIIGTDASSGRGLEGGSHRILGDILCLFATLLYGISNVSEEFLVKQNDRVEYLGLVGLFGAIISGIQLAIFEHSELAHFQWTATTVGMYLLFTVCMFCFYSLVSIVMQKTSALMFNLSVLTADFYSLLAGIFLFGMAFQVLYFVSFLVVIIGSSIYSYKKTKAKSRRERECLCRICGFCCPWAPICCGDCYPRSSYTVQDAQAEHSTPSVSLELRSEQHSSSYPSSDSCF